MSAGYGTEILKCPRCGKSGQAELTEVDFFTISFDLIPEGFKVVEGPFGSDFKCGTCNIPVMG